MSAPLFAAGRAACTGAMISWSPGKVTKPPKKLRKKARR
jgi:hypothetical protein